MLVSQGDREDKSCKAESGTEIQLLVTLKSTCYLNKNKSLIVTYHK